MRKNVGMRIMRIADNAKRVIFWSCRVWGILLILGGIIALFGLVQDLGVGAIIIAALLVTAGLCLYCLSETVAENLTLRSYGYGILVDRAEHLKEEFLDGDMGVAANTASGKTASTQSGGKWWLCSCGRANEPDNRICTRCKKPRQQIDCNSEGNDA